MLHFSCPILREVEIGLKLAGISMLINCPNITNIKIPGKKLKSFKFNWE